MTPEEKQRAIDRYAQRLQQQGPEVQALGWRDRQQQELRFAVLLSGVQIIQGQSVLDIGCGFGDLNRYLDSAGVTVRYTGCDISPEILEVARQRNPTVRFDLRDILEAPYAAGEFDHVFISGIFNHLLDDNIGFMQRIIAAAFGFCSQTVCANMTTDHVDYRDEYLHYFSPEQVTSYCLSLSRHVALRHDYPLYEFTVFIYRQANSS